MKRKNHNLILAVLIITIILSGCDEKKDIVMVEQNQDLTTIDQSLDVTYEDESLTTEERVTILLNELSLEEKAGQMLQGVRDVVTTTDMTDLGLGSILSGGGSYPGRNKLEDWDIMMKGFQKAALESKHQIPMIYGIDAVHGNALVYGAVVFPHNIGLGAANDSDLMYQMGAAVAEEMKLTKILWNFSPCVAVSGDPRWGRTYECYSSDPAIVTALAQAYIKGQADHGVVATAKHYVADGGTVFGTGEGSNLIDRGNAVMTEDELRSTYLVPYEKLVKSGVKIIMASFSSFNGVKMHENKYLLTDVLKNEFGFKGFVVSDWEAVNGLSGNSFEDNVALAINSGVDMLMEPYKYKEAINAIVEGVKRGTISEERVDDAVSRILSVKFDMGLFEDPYMINLTQEVTALGSEGYLELAKQLVEKSLVLLKNDNKTLPLQRGQKIFVTGPAANDLGLACGGWGLTWQGEMDDANGKVTEGITILEGLEAYAKTYGFEIITDKERADEADVVILAIGEIPYAEFEGDTEDLSIIGSKAHKNNKGAVDFANSLNKPVITLIVAGRNVLIDEYMDDWDSIVMCYLPGTQGDGVASVLAGETPFTGKLPMPYYKDVKDIGTENADLLFEIGFGL